MEDDAKQFIEALEARFGGPVGYRTYSTWFASDQGTVREFGVFIYEIDGVFHFEDFERKPSMFGFSMKPRKNQPPYVKFEGSFLPEHIERIETVTKSSAQSVAQGLRQPQAVAPASMLQKIFSPLVTQVVLTGGTTYFFELINQKEFIQALKEETDGRIQGV
jgi:hypothetical protein